MKLLLAGLILLGGCTATHKLTECRGTFVAANPGKWQPTDQELHK